MDGERLHRYDANAFPRMSYAEDRDGLTELRQKSFRQFRASF